MSLRPYRTPAILQGLCSDSCSLKIELKMKHFPLECSESVTFLQVFFRLRQIFLSRHVTGRPYTDPQAAGTKN
jgi:hypothetical protein